MGRQLLILDTETTGLYPGLGHQIWDLAIIEAATGAEHQWFMKPDLTTADPGALPVGRYYERTADLVPVRQHDPAGENGNWWSSPAHVAAKVARMVDGATLLISVPTFDVPFLKDFLLSYGQVLTSHHRARDICSMAHGYLRGLASAGRIDLSEIPGLDAGTDVYARALGLNTDDYDTHTALGDCKLNRAMLNVITGGQP